MKMAMSTCDGIGCGGYRIVHPMRSLRFRERDLEAKVSMREVVGSLEPYMSLCI